MGAEDRAALYRLAWDFIGSNLGARNELYERNYLASAKTNRTLGHLVYADRTRPYALVDVDAGGRTAMNQSAPRTAAGAARSPSRSHSTSSRCSPPCPS